MVRTNRWGMRDRDYELTPPPGVYRIALLGPSTAMAAGVEAEQSFEALLEARLNREAARGRRGPFEILNFGVPGYSPLQMLYQLDRKVFGVRPRHGDVRRPRERPACDLALVGAHGAKKRAAAKRLQRRPAASLGSDSRSRTERVAAAPSDPSNPSCSAGSMASSSRSAVSAASHRHSSTWRK